MSAGTPTFSSAAAQTLGAAYEHVIPRDGDRDLAFKGWRLSQVKDCQEYTTGLKQCTEVSIYMTEGEAIVTHVRQWRERQAKTEDEKHRVAVHSPQARDPGGFLLGRDGAVDEAVEWLKKDNDGELGTLSKKAWIEACRMCPPLKGHDVERVG